MGGKFARALRTRAMGLAMMAGLAAGWPAASATASEPAALAVYGQLPGFEQATISPSGDHVAILGTVDKVRQVVVLDAANAIVTRFPTAGLKVRSLEWAGDEDLLVNFSKTVGLGPEFTTSKTELTSTIVVPLDGSKAWMIFAGLTEVTGGVRGRYGLIRRDGRWLGYFGGVTMERTISPGEYALPTGRLIPDLYEVDLASHRTRRVAKRPDDEQVDRRWLLDATGNVAATLDFNRTSGVWRLYSAARVRLAEGVDPSGNVDLVGFAPDGVSVVYAVRDSKAQRDDWLTVPLAGGEARAYLPNVAVRQSFFDAGHRLIGYIEDRADGAAHFFNPLHEKIYAATRKAFPEQRMTLQDRDEAFRRLIVTTEGGGDSIAWWRVDIATGQAGPLGTAYPLPQDQVGAFRTVAYKAADGLAMEGVLTLPPGRAQKDLPAVVLPHGGPTAHDQPGFDWIAQAFASRGYAVFQPNFRGSTGYGADFELAGNGEWGRKMQSDISDGLAELVKQGVVDPKRVCIVGASYGGYAALAGVTLQQGIYRCAVAVAGISDLGRMVAGDISDSGGDPLIKRALHEEIGTGRDLAAISPLRFADKVTVPVMLIHGKDDTVVDPAQSAIMASALRRAGKSVDYVILPGEDHWLSTGATRQAMLEAAVGFVSRNNPP